jgi:hypothetical protein
MITPVTETGGPARARDQVEPRVNIGQITRPAGVPRTAMSYALSALPFVTIGLPEASAVSR